MFAWLRRLRADYNSPKQIRAREERKRLALEALARQTDGRGRWI